MRITEVARRSGIFTDQIRYLEQKGYIRPTWTRIKTRTVRDYSEEDLHLIDQIGRYLEEGFKVDVAYQKALYDIEHPRLM